MLLKVITLRCLAVAICLSFSFQSWAQVANTITSDKQASERRLLAMQIQVSTSSLLQYAARGDLSIVELMLRAGIQASTRDSVRRVTALHQTCALGHIRVTETLIKNGAEVNAQDWNGYTPLINAVYSGHVNIVKILLSNGANPNVVPLAGTTALSLAIQRRDDAIVDLLMQSGAGLEIQDAFGYTSRDFSMKFGYQRALERLSTVVR